MNAFGCDFALKVSPFANENEFKEMARETIEKFQRDPTTPDSSTVPSSHDL